MNIDDLKSDWQHADQEIHSEKELAMMTRVRNHPVLRKLRVKFVAEIIALTAFLFLFYDAFDGNQKPLFVNILLIISILLYIINNALGYSQIQNPSVNSDIRASLARQTQRLKKMAILSLSSSVFYAGALVFFLTYRTVFTQHKYIILSILIFVFMLMFYYSGISWQRKIRHFKQMQEDF
ncbi:hypothetical protein LZD49_06280 [Dyadobacter sp. CY261]|uniref:hypothetical protein n=1 Tax=Dyadobacter sp. CY261 TaxID=2907203 RepID=UPI001F491394|nr:hypothetical protein [Dyadobacter sp. CY261]MCF0070071.1 hypothetical protein [Dyadobacter sp. CY261]